MSLPEKQNGPGSSTSQARENDHQAANAGKSLTDAPSGSRESVAPVSAEEAVGMTVKEIVEFIGAIAYDAGKTAGYAQAETENRRAWSALSKKVRTAKTRRDLTQWAASDAAGRPCGMRCGRCSVCIRAAAVARRGGDYTGGLASWEGK